MKGRQPLLLLSILVSFSASCETGTFDPWLSPTQMEVEGECDVPRCDLNVRNVHKGNNGIKLFWHGRDFGESGFLLARGFGSSPCAKGRINCSFLFRGRETPVLRLTSTLSH
jgi:hypothetical protein